MCENVTILNFSSRKNGNCANISAFIRQFHQDAQVNVFVIDENFKTCGGCDYECLQLGAECPNVIPLQKQIMESVMRSDVAYLIAPNFCGFPSATFLAFNERSIGYFNMDRAIMGKYMSVKKRFIMVSNTETAAFDQAMRQQTKEDPDVLYLKTARYGKRSTAGDILDSNDAKAELQAFLESYSL